MSEENYFSVRMTRTSDSELKNYIENREDFQEVAVLAAILELEKRGIAVENSEEIKQEISELEIIEEENFEAAPIHNSSSTPILYSPKFIFIFGALFSVFGGGILMALNFIQLKKIKAAKLVVLASLTYTFLLIYLFDILEVKNAIISLMSSLFGIYLLEQLIWKKEFPTEINYEKRAIWKPILIGIAIALPMAYFLIASGNFQP
jgi:hypothetical protein